MNYSGNMPDWHQYNASQTAEVTSTAQNVNSAHLAFIPGVSSPTLNAINLNSDNLNKHQNDASFDPRNFQSYNNISNGPNIPNNGPLVSMVQMHNRIGHYSSPNTRNPMLDNMNASVDPRNSMIGNISDDIGYRNNQVPFNGPPIGHINGPSCNLNASGPGSGSGVVPGHRTNSGGGLGANSNTAGSGPIFGPGARHGPAVGGHGTGSGPGNMGPRNTNIGSVPPAGKAGPSFIPCKGLCCNSDPNINYQQWEKFGSYQNNASYRESVHASGYQMENRHFGNNCNFRKNNLEGKDVMGSVLPNANTVDQRRNFADYKYHKDHLVHRNYPTSSVGMFHNYPVQNYNYSTEHQKYSYPVKEHAKTNSMNIANSGMMKHQEQNFIAQQKYNNKQFQYQNGNMMTKGVPTLNVNANMATSPQNPYFNSQFPRNIPTEMSHECQESTDNTAMVNRMQSNFMHTSPPQQVYQHKIAMQKFSMENHLRELSRIPGYQSHPKYKECVVRYREVLKLQQSSGYQNPVQQASRVATPVNPAVPPINLQFDQNGMLINSNYIPERFPKLQHAEQAGENMDKQNKDQTTGIVDEKCQQSQQAEQLMMPQQIEHVPSSCAATQNQFSIHKDFNQNQLKVQMSESHSFDTLSSNPSNEMMQQKVSKEFANKPDLDVRQFLANWDETDDEEGTTNLPDTVLSETTPVVVVSYENVDLSSKSPQGEATRRNSLCVNETLESGKEGEVIAAQELTISYSSTENSEIAKTSKRTIGEGVVKPGSIIHCISNGPDEIPTIHIVDNLEISNILGASNDQVIQTLEKQKTISFYRESSSNDETMNLEGTDQDKSETTSVLPANYGASLNDNKNTSIEDSETIQSNTVPMSSQELRKTNLDNSDNMELKKQNSFEESHNPDDISLPDLPTSECTPISTTLNTPIHSDNEESSQNMEDLSMSTNPIEVMQNSPVISFTQLNNEEKGKNGTLGTLGLEFQKDTRYKSGETQGSHEQEVNLTSMEYGLEVQQEAVEAEKISDRNSPSSTQERKQKDRRRSTESTRSGIQSADSIDNIGSSINLSLEEFHDESESLKDGRDLLGRKKIKTSTVSTNISCSTSSENDLNDRKKAKEGINWEEKCLGTYLDKNIAQKRGGDNLRQSKGSNGRKFEDSSSFHGGEHAVCHMTSQYKHYSLAVIKDSVTLSGKRSHGSAERIMNEKSTEFATKMNNTSTKEHSGEAEARRHTSGKAISTIQENIQLQTSKLLQKNLKTMDGDVKYTAEEIRLLKEYRKKKEKSHQTGDARNNENSRDERVKSRSNHTHKDAEEEINESSLYHRNKLECSQVRQNNQIIAAHKVSLEQKSVSSVVSLNSESLEVQEEAKGHYSKSLTKATEFGIQVANVNLKIKENDIGKEMILGEMGQERLKDSMEGIKIEINVSCTDRNLKGQEQNKRLLHDDRSLYEMEDSLSYSNTLDSQRRLHAKDQEDNGKAIEKAQRTEKSEASNANKSGREMTTELNLSSSLKKARRTSLVENEETGFAIPTKNCSLTSDGQTFSKFCKNISCRDTGKLEAMETINLAVDQVDIIKSKSAISNTAIVDANNKVKGKNKEERDKEENCSRLEMQRQGSTSSDVSSLIEKEIVSVAHGKSSKKLPENSMVELNAQSLSNLSNLDFNFDKLECRKGSGLNLQRSHRTEELDEEGYDGKWKKPKIDNIFEDYDMFQSSSGFVNPIFSSIDKLEDLHTVPVYTTKDGKISYSPNRRFTYHELMMEARKREASSSARKSHYAEICNNYYSSKFRRLYKKKRHHLSERKKHEYKDTKYLYDRKRNYSDEFCSRSHGKYKDYSIRNNNAVWLGHYKVDKIYSSSDSDEEIIDRNKNRVVEVTFTNAKRNLTTESKLEDKLEDKLEVAETVSRLHKEVTIEELELEFKNGEQNIIIDGSLDGDKDMNRMDLEQTQVIPPQVNTVEDSEQCEKDSDNNSTDNLTSNMELDVLTLVQSNEGKKNTEDSGKDKTKASMLQDLILMPESVQVHENENFNIEGMDGNKGIDRVEGKITSENEESAKLKDESLNESVSKLLNEESVLSEDKQQSNSCNVEEKEDDLDEKMLVEEADIKVQEEMSNDIKPSIDQTSSLELENHSKDVEYMEIDKDLQNDSTDVSEFKDETIQETSKLQENSNKETEEVLRETLRKPEIINNLVGEIPKESEKNSSLENASKFEKETTKPNEDIEVSKDEENHKKLKIVEEEILNKEVEESVELLKHQEENTSLRNDSETNRKEPEFQMLPIDTVIHQQDKSERISIEITENENDFNRNSDHEDDVITEEQNFAGFSKDEIPTENPNATEGAITNVFIEDEIKALLPNVEETSEESKMVTSDLRNENDRDDLPSVSEHDSNSSRDSSVEKEMPVLRTCCTLTRSPSINAESGKEEIRNNEVKGEAQFLKLESGSNQNHFEQVLCKSSTHSLDNNTDGKGIPKLVIKKADALNSKSECSMDYTDSPESYDKYDAKLLSGARPKIPKMIIMKNRSRSATPIIEILEKSKCEKMQQFLPEQNGECMDVHNNSDSESYTLKYKNYESKVPKVKIKLEDISSKDLKLYLKRKAGKRSVPKVKIKKFKTLESKRIESEESSETEATQTESDNEEGEEEKGEKKNFHESMHSDFEEMERIPKLKLRRQEESTSLSPDRNRGAKNSNISKIASSKKTSRKAKEEDVRQSSTKYENNKSAVDDELRKKFPQFIIEKIPKVIIKRTQIGAEFKCEISESKKKSVAETSKWQPQVKLQRLEELDHMVRDLKQSKITLENKLSSSSEVNNDINNVATKDSSRVQESKVKLCRSNSASSLSPVKCKQRRLSDSGYMKTGLTSTNEFDSEDGLFFNDDTDRLINYRLDTSESSRNLKRRGKRRLFSYGRQVDDESEDEQGESESHHCFRNILQNEYNDLMVVKKEYSSFGTKEGTPPIIEDKFLSSTMRPCDCEDDNSIIKVDSSEESQTTIEILAASPDSSEDEAKKNSDTEFENSNEINIEGAIPTQLELELELIDNSNMRSGVLASKIDYASYSKTKYTNEGNTKAYFSEFQLSSQNSIGPNSSEIDETSNTKSNGYFYYNDLLVKEVLAAKETLKKCLSRSENDEDERGKSRPRTVAEKKQGLGFNFRDFEKSLSKSEESHSSINNDKVKTGRKSKNSEKKGYKSPRKLDTGETEERCSKAKIYSMECPTASTCGDSSVPEQTTISLKSYKRFGQAIMNGASVNVPNLSSRHSKDTGMQLQKEKIEKKANNNEDQKDNDSSNEAKIKEDNMPLLVPEFALNFDSSSDRDSSRSPPVITNQEDNEQVEDMKVMESKVINQNEKVEEDKKHSYKDCEMTIADIITQLAYHEKATIRHKRYCNLCERWFPTTSRHRRHLAGYQHRYMELTQRKSIHALFILFTGKPCPRLLPANVIRSDCSIGELTPLQIAVQDVAKCVEYTQQNHKKKE